MDTGHMNNS